MIYVHLKVTILKVAHCEFIGLWVPCSCHGRGQTKGLLGSLCQHAPQPLLCKPGTGHFMPLSNPFIILLLCSVSPTGPVHCRSPFPAPPQRPTASGRDTNPFLASPLPHSCTLCSGLQAPGAHTRVPLLGMFVPRAAGWNLCGTLPCWGSPCAILACRLLSGCQAGYTGLKHPLSPCFLNR